MNILKKLFISKYMFISICVLILFSFLLYFSFQTVNVRFLLSCKKDDQLLSTFNSIKNIENGIRKSFISKWNEHQYKDTNSSNVTIIQEFPPSTLIEKLLPDDFKFIDNSCFDLEMYAQIDNDFIFTFEKFKNKFISYNSPNFYFSILKEPSNNMKNSMLSANLKCEFFEGKKICREKLLKFLKEFESFYNSEIESRNLFHLKKYFSFYNDMKLNTLISDIEKLLKLNDFIVFTHIKSDYYF